MAPGPGNLQIALWGTLLGIVLAVPLGFLAARNLHGNRWLYQGTRQLLNVIRSINELILALVFVSAVGWGPFLACWPWRCMVWACSASSLPKASRKSTKAH